MIETKEINIDGVLQAAQKQSIDKSAPTFVSVTEKIERINAIDFFQSGKVLGKNRIYWSSADQKTIFAGIGDAVNLTDSNASYNTIKNKWGKWMQNSKIVNPYDDKRSGPIAFGGFPFDSEEPVEELWRGFDGSQFRVPTFLLTIDQSDVYLTTTVLVEQESHIDQLAAELITEKHQLLHGTHAEFHENQIVLKHEVDPEAWKTIVERATKKIADNQVNKIVLARELQVEFDQTCDIGQVLSQLQRTQQHSFVFAWEKDEVCFVGATPERLVKVNNQKVFSTCIAGTAPRGKTVEQDHELGKQLLDDQKNREEHQFVVDMIKQAVFSFAKSVHIPDEPVLYPLKNLQHLYTPVEAELDDGYTLLDVVGKLHPTPALCGFPRETALDFIRNFEKLERGWYGAPIGWFDQNFNGEFAVAIRSALINQEKASLFAGCGVVKDSDPEMEYKETAIKFTPMLHALGESK
ncbi:isochorismate synthase [Gracilibacillus caseinilyticus]|uniref:isochorismate synthase n=1 Tax=Gracilibacillus caseinilyticus TaxID=2932256 RepID=A0ABY4EUL0_9BACI|nr:isochorismate synthase [Gracilibacillus caseinilyticus]UOQ48098.1 isochorismate synthase [Gracilibacillus caseinilyticus]